MSNIFNRPLRRKLKKSTFDLGFDLKVSMEMNYLIPVDVADILPGDTFRSRQRELHRLAPQLAPFMHRLKICSYSFGVPKRLLWDGWEEFITGGERGNTTKLLIPHVTPKQVYEAFYNTAIPTKNNVDNLFGPGTLWDYMGLPPVHHDGSASYKLSEEPINWLPFRAYYSIWYEYFRDQNVVGGDGYKPRTSDDVSAAEIRLLFTSSIATMPPQSYKFRPFKKAWEKDYFTAGLPWPQRGPEVHIPGTVSGQVVSNGMNIRFDSDGADPLSGSPEFEAQADGIGGSWLRDSENSARFGPETGLKFESDEGALGTINELRTANRLQMWLERAARSGGRLTEHLLGHWGEFNKDSRLQRPEWLGSSVANFYGEAVLQTSFSNDDSAQANPAGNAEHKGYGLRWKRHFSEDSFVITIQTIIPNTSYQDGIPRMYSRLERFDHAFPDFAHLGEQAVKNKEVYAPWLPDAKDADGDFSYVPRYADYKYIPSRVAGDFRSSLAHWHMGRMFYDPLTGEGSAPLFNRSFVEADASKRIFPSQVEGDDVVWSHIAFERKVTRKLPKWPTPKL